jgi:hypothetical protein
MAITAKAPVEAPAAPAPVQTIILTPALYERYLRADVLYEKDQPYRFTVEQAATLLAEQDTDRPLWKRWSDPAKVRQQEFVESAPVVKDMTASTVKELPDAEDGSTAKVINVGDDSEIADILNATDTEGAVKV